MKLNYKFSDNMVLQAHKPLKFYGTGKGKVSVSLCGKTSCLESDKESWLLTLPPMEYGGPYTLAFDLDGEKVEIKNVCIGEVILCAGQSNMEFKLSQDVCPKEKYKYNDKVRFFCEKRPGDGEAFYPTDGWIYFDKDISQKVTDIGYFVGNEVAEKLGVAVGIVGCFQGASTVQSWTDKKIISDGELCVPMEKRHVDSTHLPYSSWNDDGFLYNYSFEDTADYTYGNVIWYQGESNTSMNESKLYARLLDKMIDCWRKRMGDEALPFTIIQIADCDEREQIPWKEVQRQQEYAVRHIHDTRLVVSRDVCESGNIHPSSKEALSHRTAECVLEFLKR